MLSAWSTNIRKAATTHATRAVRSSPLTRSSSLASLRMSWLVKEDPTNYSYDEFVADGRTVWSGVPNPLAQKHLRSMKKGDRVFYYHTGKEKAIVGTAKV